MAKLPKEMTVTVKLVVDGLLPAVDGLLRAAREAAYAEGYREVAGRPPASNPYAPEADK